jgi:hypothetical protein
MWPYTNDESNWLEVVAVIDATRSHPADRPSIAELERAARRYRARVIGEWLRSAFLALRELIRRALHRPAAKPSGLANAD